MRLQYLLQLGSNVNRSPDPNYTVEFPNKGHLKVSFVRKFHCIFETHTPRLLSIMGYDLEPDYKKR